MAETKDVIAKVVGIYGVSGCGKTTLLQHLEGRLGTQRFAFYDGSTMIAECVEGGLDAFKSMSESQKYEVREQAILRIREQCESSQKIGIVTGHLVLWNYQNATPGNSIWTHADARTYTGIIYLSVPPKVVVKRRADDNRRKREKIIADHVAEWQKQERQQLEDMHKKYCVFTDYVNEAYPFQACLDILKSDWDERLDIKVRALECLDSKLAAYDIDQIINKQNRALETMVLLDGDKTLAPVDTGHIFWEKLLSTTQSPSDTLPSSLVTPEQKSPLKTLFGKYGYHREAFSRATELYEKITDFEDICARVASDVTMYPQIVSFLKIIQQVDHVGAVVVSCGLRRVWEMVLKKEGLHDSVKVIGGGRFSYRYVVTGKLKAQLVDHLQVERSISVWAIGDSPLDLEMLEKADQALVVVGEEEARSKSMDQKLQEAIDTRGLKARQVVLPNSAPLRLDKKRLPPVELNEDLISSICEYRTNSEERIFQASNTNAARLLMTPTRDANIHGPALQECHARIGWYLAVQFLSEITGLEEYSIPHVQGHFDRGFRLAGEQRTLVVALMRAGEPLARGVSSALPLAAFLHAKEPKDITLEYMKGRRTIILADGVVNSGSTVMKFIDHIRQTNRTVRIVIVTGVTQAKAVQEGLFSMLLKRKEKIYLVTLRISENKYTGKGGTDTGHRLFNTTFRD